MCWVSIVVLYPLSTAAITEHHGYAYQTSKTTLLTTVFCINANSSTRFRQGYRNVADHLMILGREDTEANILQLVYDWLSDRRNGQWLIILDNVDVDGMLFADDSMGRQHEGCLLYTAHRERP